MTLSIHVQTYIEVLEDFAASLTAAMATTPARHYRFGLAVHRLGPGGRRRSAVATRRASPGPAAGPARSRASPLAHPRARPRPRSETGRGLSETCATPAGPPSFAATSTSADGLGMSQAMTTTTISPSPSLAPRDGLITLAPTRQRLALRVVLWYLDEGAPADRAIEDSDQPNLWSARSTPSRSTRRRCPTRSRRRSRPCSATRRCSSTHGVACGWADRVERESVTGARSGAAARADGQPGKKRGGYVTIAYEMGAEAGQGESAA